MTKSFRSSHWYDRFRDDIQIYWSIVKVSRSYITVWSFFMLNSRKEKIMDKKELVLLMTAITKGGKTTIATALCHPNSRNKMVSLSNCRTEVTVDWTYDPEATDIKLKKILLNYQGVFGTESKERINCNSFSKVLDSDEGKYLQDIFGLEKQENLSCTELEQYVLDKIKDYVNNCNNQGLAEIIKNRLSNRFLRRIKVVVPPVNEFVNFFNEQKVSLVLRDTRGLLDIDAEEATDVKFRTMQELGIDGIDAVLLLGTSAPFPDPVEWYKKAYKSAFESVPIFIMTRPDSVSTSYDLIYGIDDENVTVENVHDFLQSAKKGTERGFKEFPNTYLQCYRLLEMFEVGKITGIEFQFNYKVYNNEDLCYVYPNSTALVQNATTPDYSSADYRLYELVVFENLKDMISKMINHNHFIEAISTQIKADFAAKLQSNTKVHMYPEYRKYDENTVCNNIMNGDILGPRQGIVTTEHGDIIYLGAITSAVSSRIWLRNAVSSYKYSGTLTNPDGSNMKLDIPNDCRDNLIRMALFHIIEKNTDCQAYFQNYYFIDRDIVYEAILRVRNNNPQGNALNNTSKEIANIIFN
jgi:hypothetical protein